MLASRVSHHYLRLLASTSVVTMAFGLGGCRYLKDRLKMGSDIKVIGGDKDYEHNPGVIGILVKSSQGTSVCTASVVREDLIVTAAHCLVDKEATEVLPFFNLTLGDKDPFRSRQLASNQFIPEPSYDKTDVASSYDSDIAFVVFPKGTFKDYPHLKFAEKAAAVSDPVTLVGYGQIVIQDKKSNPDLKRYLGTNQIKDIKADAGGTIWLDTKVASAITAGIGQGDSGGPLLNAAGEIIAIAHANDFRTPDGTDKPTNDHITAKNPLASIYTNLTQAKGSEFIKKIMATSDPKPAVPAEPKAPVLISKADALKCKDNKFCKDGWGWLSSGESDCTDTAAGWVADQKGCSCDCE
ncbi:MAG: S1 family peptidase [Deltaproteobacteria bacterium]|nr:S1 family peptidase [Deltaproteobacteria bacterium]